MILAGESTVRGLVVNAFEGIGVRVETNGGNIIDGNFIGTDVSGTAARGNGAGGVEVRNAPDNTIRDNLISGNGGSLAGLLIISSNATGNHVEGNFIGTDASGTAAVGNTAPCGVLIAAGVGNTIGGTTPAARNLISGNSEVGACISTDATENRVIGNYVGTDVTGRASVGNGDHGIRISNRAFNNIVGGTTLGARNVVSGNLGSGVVIRRGTANHVQGNLIGVDVTGGTTLGNALDGIFINRSIGDTIGGTTAAAGNVISGNGRDGIGIIGQNEPLNPPSTLNVVQGNYIGTDPTGTSDLGNGRHGVFFGRFAMQNTIGGTTPNAGNTIAFNGAAGVFVELETSEGNAILSNAIFSNATRGIDLAPAGVTPNDPGDVDEGPNDLQNFPDLSGFTQLKLPPPGTDPGTITGTLTSTPGTPFTLQFFSNPVCDRSTHGEGETLLATLSVTTDGLGGVDFSASIPTLVAENAFLTATATDDNTGSTSEFSRCRPAGYTVVDGGGLEITDAPLLVGPGSGPGFLLVADPTGGARVTVLEVCSVPRITMTAGDRITVGCGSAIIDVEVGPIEIQLDDNTEAIVPADALVTVEEVDEGQLQIQNDSPAGTDPVQIAVGGEVVGEIGSGESILGATVAVTTAEVRLAAGDEADADEFEVAGTLTLGSTNDGIDLPNEAVTVVLGSFTETVTAGSFERDEAGNGFKLERDPVAFAGITEMKITDTGEFTIEARNLHLSALDLTQPVSFALHIGDDIGSLAIPFDEDGEFQDLDAAGGAILAGAFDLRVGPERLTIAPRQAATFTVSLGARGVFAGKTVSLACADLPDGASCSFAPRTLTPDAGGATSVLTVTTDGSEGVLSGASRRAQLPLGLGLAALVLGGLVLTRSHGRRRRRTFLSLGLVLLAVGLYTACADEVLTPRGMQPTPRGTHAFKVIATAGTEERVVAVTLTVGDVPTEDPAVRGAIR